MLFLHDFKCIAENWKYLLVLNIRIDLDPCVDPEQKETIVNYSLLKFKTVSLKKNFWNIELWCLMVKIFYQTPNNEFLTSTSIIIIMELIYFGKKTMVLYRKYVTILFCLFLLPSREFVIHLETLLTITDERLQILIYARHLRLLSSEGYVACHL